MNNLYPKMINTINLKTISIENEIFNTNFEIVNPVIANAILMNSFVHLSSQFSFTGTDSLMPPTICKLFNNQQVIANDTLELQSNIFYGTNLETCNFEIKNRIL